MMTPNRGSEIDPKRYIVCGDRPWSRTAFDVAWGELAGEWRFVPTQKDLTSELMDEPYPSYVFFLHWSSIVPAAIHEKYECVCFHMTDVPYGRGGSPLQNLIARGHRKTCLTALRMVSELDAGPVYLKRPLSLEGGAEEIYLRASHLSMQMARTIAETRPEPVSQKGEPVVFSRRTPAESELTAPSGLEQIHDQIRMLDAEGYPRAFIERDGFIYEFERPALYCDAVKATVTIRPKRDAAGLDT